jgi:hypothetical protein
MKAGIDVSVLRHPHERVIWAVAVVLNVVLCVGAVGVVIREGVWLFTTFPFLQQYEGQIRGIAVAAVLAPPLLVLTRNRRLARVRGNGVKVTATQYAPLHARFQAHCEKLQVDAIPRLYVSDHAVDEKARAYTSWKREYVVLGDDYLEKDLFALQDVWSFLMARELARLALGHVDWQDELLLAYVERLPWVRRPLRHARAYSLDRIAAFLEPDGVRALVIQASGRRVIPSTNIAEQIRYARSIGGFWARFTNAVDERPLLAVRLQQLYDEGLFDLEYDLRRFERSPDGRGGSPESDQEGR